MPALIEARDLTKNYGSQLALDRVNFKVESGRIVGLIGPNGAGKTSALRAILGLTAYQGQLNVLGLEPFRNRAARGRKSLRVNDALNAGGQGRLGADAGSCHEQSQKNWEHNKNLQGRVMHSTGHTVRCPNVYWIKR